MPKTGRNSKSTVEMEDLLPPPLPPLNAYRVLIADDHAVVRCGLRSLLSGQPGIEICGEASDGAEAVARTKSEKPDLLVLDLTMPEKNGLDVLQEVRATVEQTAVLVLSMHFSDELARQVLRLGALGYMLKSDADVELLAAVDHMRHNQPFFTGRLALSMAQNFVDGSTPALEGQPQLTEREVQVIQLLCTGKSNKEVAAELGVSTRTVESHRNHIMRKLEFQSFSDLVRFAIRSNLIEA